MKKGFSSSTKSQFKLPKKPSIVDIDFLFVGRRYKLALKGYNQLIRRSDKGALKSEEYEHLFWQKLVLFSRIWRDPAKAILSFEEDLKADNLPTGLPSRVKTWVAQFKAWQMDGLDLSAIGDIEAVRITTAAIDRIAASNDSAMKAPTLIELLRHSGGLYELLFETEQVNLHPQILQSLAKPLQWISLQDVYLKRCVTLFPESNAAPGCLKGYKSMRDKKCPGR